LDKAPDAFRTISEVAEDLDVPQHVLRFWETRFPQIRPMKRAGGRRYYRPDDVDLVRGIRHLLYGEGYTIRGVQRILRDQGTRFVQTVWQAGAEAPPPRDDDDLRDDGASRPEESEADDGRGLIDRLPALLGRGGDGATADPWSDRREPPLEPAPAPRVDPSDRIAAAAAPSLARAETERLQAVLQDLVQCRQILDAAIEGRT
jgi:DNA-binding transcriptional MerR regulator